MCTWFVSVPPLLHSFVDVAVAELQLHILLLLSPLHICVHSLTLALWFMCACPVHAVVVPPLITDT